MDGPVKSIKYGPNFAGPLSYLKTLKPGHGIQPAQPSKKVPKKKTIRPVVFFWVGLGSRRGKVSVFYTAPTAIRSLMKSGDEPVTRNDLSSLRRTVFGWGFSEDLKIGSGDLFFANMGNENWHKFIPQN